MGWWWEKRYLLLTGLENVPVVQEERLHLVDTARGDEGEVEDGKETQLHGEGAVAHFPEGEAAEEGCEDVQGDLVPHVVLPLSVYHFFGEREREREKGWKKRGLTGDRQSWVISLSNTKRYWNHLEVAKSA